MSLFRQDPLIATLLQGVTQSLAESRSNSTRQDRHEVECSDRYRDVTRAIEKLSARMFGLILSVAGSIIIALIVVLYNVLHAKGVL